MDATFDRLTKAQKKRLFDAIRLINDATAGSKNQRGISMVILRATHGVDEHPEDYEGECLCNECCSYD